MQPSAAKIWDAAQDHLRSMLNADTYNLWFAPLRACATDDSTLVLEVANEFCEVWLKDNYLSLLQDVVQTASGQKLQVKFRVASPSPTAPASVGHGKAKPVAEPAAERTVVAQELSFNPKNTF